ncbi:MAG TPA: LptF/LptG family permease [Anaeromyxobacteraceae bacterium]|nr:LptF/LptG family permease [Anaeromyxobacteraceae bacterium]
MRLARHLAWRALVAFALALAAVVALFLVVDFAENAGVFRGPGWMGAVLALYANRAAVVAYQTAPAALLLAAAVTASDLRRTREYTALRALGLGPWRVAVPVLAVALAVAAALAWMGEGLVVEAGARADAIMASRFGRGPGLGRSAERKRWFRGRDGKRIYHLRGGGEGGVFERVTVLEVTDAFRLARRIDAERMEPGPGGAWVLSRGAERAFGPGGRVETTAFERRTYRFDEDPAAFAVRPGRPASMRRSALGEQIALRRRLGLPWHDFALEWHERLAYPLAVVPAALVALGLALRRERRGHLTAALVEAVGISLAFWGAQAICTSLGGAGRIPPAAAAWAPDVLFLAAGLLALRRLA